jgi:cysteine desulfurase
MIYLDHNATTPPLPEAVQAVLAALQQVWANPSSAHEPGQAAKRLLAGARAQVAQLLGCQPVEIVFTSGATEANHLAVLGALARGRASGRPRLLLSAVEHAGLLALAERLRGEGTPVDLIAVDAQGRLDLAHAASLLGPDVALLSVQAANNETGVCMPLAELAALARAHGVPFHCDATQAVGKQALRFDGSGADLWSLSAHKLQGPKGVGALLQRKGLSWPALIAGRQERGRRGGTENLPGIAGFGAAAEQLAMTLDDDLPRMTALRQRLESGLLALHPAVQVQGLGAPRLANTVSWRLGRVDAERVLHALARGGVVASSGAACSAGGSQPSHVLRALGLADAEARAGVRFSLGRSTTAHEIDQVLALARQALPPLLAEALATT